jgi:hypothetical protein
MERSEWIQHWMVYRLRRLSTLLIFLVLPAQAAVPPAPSSKPVPIDLFFQAGFSDRSTADAALAKIAAGWQSGYAAMVFEVAEILRRTQTPDSPTFVRYLPLINFLQKQTGQSFGDNLDGWRHWIWHNPYNTHPEYAAFKRRLYGLIDPGFKAFFRMPLRSSIRLDEIEWGGVKVNGIPPLDHPRHIPAAEASYLQDDNVVFGVYFNGIARAYPKRILAWHELARDRVGDVDLTMLYCTLCGTVIPYESRVGGVLRTFGTSGLLYRSNKLMFDAESHSLWSSLDGTPVVGPLVGSGLSLSLLPVVTTTWGEWRHDHPDTTVLSIDTGFQRDYSEGAAYRGYFATDALLFQVPKTDDRLKNKDEVLVLRLPPQPQEYSAPVAIASDFLRKHRVYEVDVAGHHLIVLTTAAGANRVYESGSYRFRTGGEDDHLQDTNGNTWIAKEDALQAVRDPTLLLPRVPAHRSFWFGWYAQHPDTRLIK